MSDAKRPEERATAQPGGPPGSALELSSLSPLALLDIDFELTDSRTEMVKRIRWLIRVRYAVSVGVVALMMFTGWQGLTHGQTLTRSTLLATLITGAVAVVLNIAYFLHLRLSQQLRPRLFVLLQLLVDVLIFSSYVYRSGGVTSPFNFLYLLPIIAAAMMVSERATLGVALWSSICFGALALLEATGSVEHVSYFVALDMFALKWSYVSLMLLVNPVAFFTVAVLSLFLMRTVRAKTRELTTATRLLDRRAELLQMLVQVSRCAVDSRTSDEVLDRIGELLVTGLNLDRALLYLVHEDGDRLVLTREFYHPRLRDQIDRSNLRVEIPLRPDAGVTARCALRQQPENVTDPGEHRWINQDLAQRIGHNPFAVAPLLLRGQLLGVVGVDRKFELGVIEHDDFQVLIAFADQAAATLHTARLERSPAAAAPPGNA